MTIELVAHLHKAVSLLLKEKSEINARYTNLRKEHESLTRLYRSALLRESSQNTADGFFSHYVISLRLGSRLTNILRSYEIFYIGDLVAMTEAEMLRMPRLGKQSIRQIQQALDIRGLHLGMDVSDWQRPAP
jgi:DNA-directed RNA polymerase alpha subunit